MILPPTRRTRYLGILRSIGSGVRAAWCEFKEQRALERDLKRMAEEFERECDDILLTPDELASRPTGSWARSKWEGRRLLEEAEAKVAADRARKGPS